MKKNMVSVVMSAYNEKNDILESAIRSILEQTYKDFEFIIIIDDPNNKGLIETVNKFVSDKRISVYINSENIGLAASLNKGISKASGIYIARMDADDVAMPHRLEKEILYLQTHSECDMVCSNRIDIDDDGKVLSTIKFIPRSDNALLKSIRYGSIITHPTVVIKSSTLKELGGYNCYKTSQDYDLWLRMSWKKYRMHFINEPLIFYRRRKTSISNTKRIIQFLSYNYINCSVNKKKNFDENEYLAYINNKLNDNKYVDCFNRFSLGLENKDILEIIRACFENRDCRKKLLNSIKIRCYIKAHKN